VDDARKVSKQRHDANLNVPQFSVGDLVFLKQDRSLPGLNTKYLALYNGLFQIVEVRFPLVRLMDVHTGRVNSHYTNVMKLRKSCQDDRQLLFDR